MTIDVGLCANEGLQFYGTYVPVNQADRKILAFLRTQGPWRSLVFCNWSQEESDFEIPEEIDVDLAVLKIANYPVSDDPLDKKVRLRPYEARIYSLRN